MSTKMPIAVIPNFNMGPYAMELATAALEIGYERAVIIDDGSTDIATLEVLRANTDEQHGLQVRLYEVNLGAGANRNRILDDPALNDTAVLHFMDADMRFADSPSGRKQTEMPHVVMDLLSVATNHCIVGGHIYTPELTDHPFNYGPIFTGVLSVLHNYAEGGTQQALYEISRRNPEVGNYFRRKLRGVLDGWPDWTKQPPTTTMTGFVTEGNMAVYAAEFAALGGFDPRLRNHEIQLMGAMVAKAGKSIVYSPDFALQHLAIDVRGHRRRLDEARAVAHIVRTNRKFRHQVTQ